MYGKGFRTDTINDKIMRRSRFRSPTKNEGTSCEKDEEKLKLPFFFRRVIF